MRNPGGKNPLDFASVKKDEGVTSDTSGHSPILLYLFFKPGATEQLVNEFLLGDVKTYLFDHSNLVYEPGTEPIHYTIFVEKNIYTARIMTKGISRFPVQVYESIVCLILFMVLFFLWKKHTVQTPAGRIFGLFALIYSSMLFAFSYLKEKEIPMSTGIGLSIGQLASLLLLIIGVVALIYSYKKAPVTGK